MEQNLEALIQKYKEELMHYARKRPLTDPPAETQPPTANPGSATALLSDAFPLFQPQEDMEYISYPLSGLQDIAPTEKANEEE